MTNRFLILAKRTALGFLLICVMLGLSCGCGIPSVRHPYAVSDSTGSIIIVYQVNEGSQRTTYVQKLGLNGETLWYKQGTPLYSEKEIDAAGCLCALIVNSNENTILMWGNINGLWVQKLDSYGYLLWQPSHVQIVSGGVSDFKIAGNGTDSVVVGWTNSFYSLSIEKISNEGNPIWSNNPLSREISRDFDLSCDNEGNTFVIWENRQNNNVYVQKIGANGQLAWASDILVSDAHSSGANTDKVIGDEVGGAIVTWIHWLHEQGHITDPELYAQRISADGNIIWQPGGVLIRSSKDLEERIGFPLEPQIVRSGDSGVIIVWREEVAIYAQKVDENGSILWGKGGIQVWKDEYAQGSICPYIVSDETGGVIISWCYTPKRKTVDESTVIQAQRLDYNGHKVWGNNGILVNSGSASYSLPPVISQDGSGGAIITWSGGTGVQKISSSYVQRINSAGTLLFSEEGFKLN